MNELVTGLTALTALGCGLVAGTFFAFSAFVMRALSRLPARDGIAAMQAINKAAIPSTFFLTGLATTVGCVGLTIWAVGAWHEPTAPWVLAGAGAYLGGAMLVTVKVHLPRNDALALIDPEATDADTQWKTYRPGWTLWNHVRAGSALIACGALIASLVAG